MKPGTNRCHAGSSSRCSLLFSAILTGAAAIGIIRVAMAPFARREADAKIAFSPLFHLEPDILANGFGVFHVKFGPDSGLTDGNASELLTLNRLPAEYELTLWLQTPKITDASVPVLSKLTTTDSILIQGARLSEEAMKRLASTIPSVADFSKDEIKIVHPSLQP